MIKKVLWIGVGVVAALEADRWWSSKRERWRPRVLTGTLLDKLNKTLEERNGAAGASGAAGPRG